MVHNSMENDSRSGCSPQPLWLLFHSLVCVGWSVLTRLQRTFQNRLRRNDRDKFGAFDTVSPVSFSAIPVKEVRRNCARYDVGRSDRVWPFNRDFLD